MQKSKVIVNQSISWKLALKDVLKFHFYLLILNGLGFLLLQFFIAQTLETHAITNAESYLRDSRTSLNFQTFFQTMETLTKQTGLIMFFLACFGTFFSIPPKSLQHVIAVSLFISVLSTIYLFSNPLLSWLWGELYLLGSTALAYTSSHIWNRMTKKGMR